MTHLTDLSSLGATAYCLFTGAPPFEHPQLMAVLMAHASKAPQPPRERNPTIPPALDAAILKLLEKDPARRFQSCDELAQVLRQLREALAQAPAAPPRAATGARPAVASSGSGVRPVGKS